MWTNIKRVFKAGFVTFWRNKLVSASSVFVMVISLFVIGSIVLGQAVLNSALLMIKDKVDINIYIKTDAGEKDILTLKTSMEALPEVNKVEYASREQVLEDFKTRHADNSLILSSLDELKDNPLGAVLSVKAKEPSQYEGIAKFLEGETVGLNAEGASIVDKVNFFQNKVVIDRLSRLIESVNKIGFAVSVVFVLLAVLVAFNTVSLVIHNSREEISVMRLVGASNWYIRGPFMVGGIMSGVIASIIALLLFIPATTWIGDKTESFFAGINLFGYYGANFLEMFVVIFGTGILLGAVSSFLAVRNYLHV